MAAAGFKANPVVADLVVLMADLVAVPQAALEVCMAVVVAPEIQEGQMALEAEAQSVLFGPDQLDNFLQRLLATYECAGF